MKRILGAGVTALVTAWSLACGDIEINAPAADWPDWRLPGDTSGRVRVPFEWLGQIQPGRQVEIKGLSGAIHATAASGSDVVVKATKIGQPNNVAAVHIDVVSHSLGVTICAVYPRVVGQPPNTCEPGDAGTMSVRDSAGDGVSVEFVVEVPSGVTLVARTLSGDVVAAGLDSDAFVSSLAGDIEVSTTRLATAKTNWGSVVASIGLDHWGRDLEFSTMTGDVSVTVPATTDAQVRATVQWGDITSDFPLNQVGPGDMRGTIGSGGPGLRLATLTGDIRLKRGG
jgi:hypothetical protein